MLAAMVGAGLAEAQLPAGTLYADSFDYPFGNKIDTNGWTNVQGVGGTYYAGKWHCGEDWNTSNDLGKPIYSIANGKVVFADSAGGYGTSPSGKVVVVTHYLPNGTQLQSQYGHGRNLLVRVGDSVLKGQQLMEIGEYYSPKSGGPAEHLHFELRSRNVHSSAWNRPGYAYTRKDSTVGGNEPVGTPISLGWLIPTQFIAANRILGVVPYTPSVSMLTLPDVGFDWSDVANASAYRIQISTSPSAWSPITGFGSGLVVNAALNQSNNPKSGGGLKSSYIWTSGSVGSSASPVAGQQYWWSVRDDVNNVFSNPTPGSRSASARYSPVTLIAGSGPPTTTLFTTLNRSSINFPGTGGTETITVTSNQNWSVTKDHYLLQTNRSSGSGNGSVVVTCAPNPRGRQDTAQVIIGGQIVNVTIAAAPTNYTNISSSNQPGISEYGAQYGIGVSSNQSWSVYSNKSWARVSTSSGYGNGTVQITVDRNTNTVARSATIVIGSQNHTLTQNAASSYLTIWPQTSQVPAAGGPISVTVNTNQSFSVSESSDWLSAYRSGSTVYVDVAQNSQTSPRTTSVFIGSQTHTVTQAGATPNVSLSPASHSITSTGGSYSILIESNTSWSTSTNTSWARPLIASSSGSAWVTIQCDANYDTSSRYANITVGGQIHRLTQSGASSSSSTVSNDMFRNAYPLSGSSVTRSGNSSGASVEAGESSFSTNDNGDVIARKTVWFKWSPPSDAIYYAATKGSGYDTVLGVYTGSSVSGLSRVTANDDADGTRESRVRFVARANTTYYISIGAFGSSPGGAYSLQIGRNLSSGTVYATSFESNEGFTLNSDLIGVNGWTGEGTAGSGILSGYMAGEGQQAFVGYSAGVTEDSLIVSRPVNHVPVMSEKPRAVFSVKMQITDSTNLGYDDFKWTAYNTAGHALFSLNFDNYNTTIGYTLDGMPTSIQPTDISFENGRNYDLVVTMDFATNLWSATLDGALLVSDQLISATGALMTLGKIDASWGPQVPEFPGDNRMIFDNYKIEELESRSLSFTTQMAESGSLTFIRGETIHLASPDEGNPTRAYQWRFNGVDIDGAIEPALIIENADMTHAGSYAVVITDGDNSQEASPVIVTVLNHTNTAFGNWLAATFTNGEGVEIAGAYADPDGDGVSNFGEYAFGGDPESSASAPHAVLVNPTATGHDLEFFRLIAPDGVGYAIEVSTDLSEWIEYASATVVPVAAVPAPSGYERVKVTLPKVSEISKRFYRVRALID